MTMSLRSSSGEVIRQVTYRRSLARWAGERRLQCADLGCQ